MSGPVDGRSALHPAAFDAPAAAPAKTKRVKKATLTGGVRKQVYLDTATIDGAKKLGDNELSAGLREAVKIALEVKGADLQGERRPNKKKG